MSIIVKSKIQAKLLAAGQLIESHKFKTAGERLVQNAAAEAIAEALLETEKYPAEQGFALENVIHILAMKAAHNGAYASSQEVESRATRKGKR